MESKRTEVVERYLVVLNCKTLELETTKLEDPTKPLGLERLYKAIDCDCIDVLRNFNERFIDEQIDIFFDDNGKVVENPKPISLVLIDQVSKRPLDTIVGNVVFSLEECEDNYGLTLEQIEIVKNELMNMGLLTKDGKIVKAKVLKVGECK